MPAGNQTIKSKSKGKGNTRAKAISGALRAQVTLPPSRIMRLMKKDRLNKTIRRDSSVFMAGVLDYICQEILELAGEYAMKMKKNMIKPRHIKLAIAEDEELCKILGQAVIHEGGVVPHIEAALLPKQKGKKGAEQS